MTSPAEQSWTPPPWQPPPVPHVEEALAASTDVVEEKRRWIVYLNVVLVSGAVRKKVGEYHDERRATHAAKIIERNAKRCITRPMTVEPESTARGES